MYSVNAESEEFRPCCDDQMRLHLHQHVAECLGKGNTVFMYLRFLRLSVIFPRGKGKQYLKKFLNFMHQLQREPGNKNKGVNCQKAYIVNV